MNPAVIKAKTAKPLDRRARRTRQAIKESFAALAANQPLPDLTVKEVMERALAEGTDETPVAPGLSAEELAERWHAVDELPFDFERRRLSVVVGDAASVLFARRRFVRRHGELL